MSNLQMLSFVGPDGLVGILLAATAIEASDGIAGSNTPGAFFPLPCGIANEMQDALHSYGSFVNYLYLVRNN